MKNVSKRGSTKATIGNIILFAAGCALIALLITGQVLLREDDNAPPSVAAPAFVSESNTDFVKQTTQAPSPVTTTNSLFAASSAMPAATEEEAASSSPKRVIAFEERLKAASPPERPLCGTLARRDAVACQRLRDLGKVENTALCEASAQTRLDACNHKAPLPSLNYVP